ncbi:MAG: S8 family serine peptidase [Deltaproteobacteria bacterium]|nr:S8 family serine peptidase [Deltaproteobacteria bacterium]
MHTDEVASFSNFGGSLDLVAPGGGDAGGESIISPERSILSLLSTAARQSDGWAAVCQLRCIACQDGRPPLSDGQPCPPNYCVETGDVCTEDGCHFKCVRCRDGTVLPPESNTCPNYDNTCKEYRETCEPGPWVVGEDYVRGSGTSFAAPHVSGVAALVRSHHPSFSQPQVRQVLRNTADDLGPPGWDEHFGYGRVNAAQAVAIEDIPVAEILTPENRGKIWERDFPFNVIGTVTPSVDGLGRWRLTIRPQAGGEAAEVASGSSAVMNGILGTLDLGGRLALEPGQRYVLDLAAQDTLGQVARDSKMFLIPNPQFAAIPVPDPFDEGGGDGSLSSDGQRLALVRSDRAGNGSSAWTFDNRTGTLTRIRQAAQARISPDGQFVLYADTTDFVYWRYVLKDIDSGAFQVVPLGDLWSATPAPFSLADYGRRVAFLSGQDVDPLIGNPDGSIEAFLFDLPNGPARQLTDGPRASFGQPEIEDDLVMTPDGQWLAFSGRTDLDPTSSTGGGDQVFVYDDGARRLRQISGRSSDGPQWGLRPSLSADGTKVAFAGDGIYLANPNSGTADRLLDSQGAPDIPLLSADATKLAFIAALDLDPGVANEDLSPELFLMDLKTMQIGQITDSVNFPYVRYGTVMDATGCAFLTAPGDLNGLALHPGISRFVRRRPGNRAPIIEPLPPIVISEGKISHVPLHAHDADGDPITFHVERNPFGDPYQGRLNGLARSVLEDHADGTADLQLAPCYGTAGQYGLRIAAFDGAGEVAVRAATLEIQESVRQPDINQDGRTDGNDLAILVESLFGRHRYTSIRCDPSDLNDDTLLSAADIVAWLTR